MSSMRATLRVLTCDEREYPGAVTLHKQAIRWSYEVMPSHSTRLVRCLTHAWCREDLTNRPAAQMTKLVRPIRGTVPRVERHLMG